MKKALILVFIFTILISFLFPFAGLLLPAEYSVAGMLVILFLVWPAFFSAVGLVCAKYQKQLSILLVPLFCAMFLGAINYPSMGTDLFLYLVPYLIVSYLVMVLRVAIDRWLAPKE